MILLFFITKGGNTIITITANEWNIEFEQGLSNEASYLSGKYQHKGPVNIYWGVGTGAFQIFSSKKVYVLS